MHWAGTENRQVRHTVLQSSTVQDMIGPNQLLQQVKKDSGQAMRIFSFPDEERSVLIGWGDAALQNRIDGGSTTGLLCTCSSVRALQGEESLMSVISWEEWPNRPSVS